MPALLKRCLHFFVLLPSILVAQVFDDFSDGELLGNPEWTGDHQVFIVNNSYQLQLNDEGAGNSSLYTPVPVIEEMEWRCWIRLAFSPSSNNHSRIYLLAESPDTSGIPDGIFIQLGESGSNDRIRLMKQEGADTSTMISGTPGAISSSLKCRIKVILNVHSWELYVDYTGGKDFQLEGSCLRHPVPGTPYLGVFCKYTASNSKKFYFDDIYAGPVLIDTTPDINRYDVLINEIMADPSPPIGLPEYEYLELFNISAHQVDLYDWKLIIGGSEKSLTGAKIDPGGYIIIGKQDASGELGAFGEFWGLESFSLSNAGQEIFLLNHKDELIHHVYYHDHWYKDNDKSGGGYSLEMINPFNPCLGSENWSASEYYKGGTPGTANSVFDNIYSAPEVIRACVIDPERIKLIFNQSMDINSGMDPDIFSLDQGVGAIEAILPADPWLSSFILYPENPLAPGHIYTLSCNSFLSNCKGDSIMITESIPLGLPQDPEWNDVVINEVLFDPFPGGSDYVELFNRSDKAISLSGMRLASVKHTPPAPPDTSTMIIFHDCVCLLPGDHVVLCKDISGVDHFYHCPDKNAFLSSESFPSFNNEKGNILLITAQMELLDIFSYHEDMHYPLLNSTEGVSLERIHYNRPSNDESNWHSASSLSGFGTPGYENSQFMEEGQQSDPVNISPKVFSPGFDGIRDHIGIHYNFSDPGLLASIKIFSASGYPVRHLVNNELLGASGTFSWNGLCDDNSMAPAGIYVILFELVDIKGKVMRYKKTAVVAPRI